MEFNDISLNFMILWLLGIPEFLCDLGGPGHLKTINIPIGISTFSAWGRQEPSKSPKNWFPRILQRIQEFCIFSWKWWNYMKFNGNLVICWFWESHGAGPSIWPRKNQRFVKGHGFVGNAEFLEFQVISWNSLISHKFMEIHDFTRNP